MRMDLIQPFIGSLDAVLAEMMKAPAKIADLTMEEDGYRRKGLAASVAFKGQIEGRIILDMEPRAAAQVASYLSGGDVDPDEPIVPGDGLRTREHGDRQRRHAAQRSRLSVQGFPACHSHRRAGRRAGQDSEATILCFETPNGNVHLNIAMQYHARRHRERAPAVA